MVQQQPVKYFTIAQAIFEERYKLSIHAKIVFCYLSKCANRNTATCYPSRTNISKSCSIGKTSVGKALNELSKCGLISIQSQFRQNNSQRNNLYTVLAYPRKA